MDRIERLQSQSCAGKSSNAGSTELTAVSKPKEGMITLLDPELIAQSGDIIDGLGREGLNHLTKDAKLGWNYVLDHVWITRQIEQYIANKERCSLTILDVGCGKSRFHNFLEKRFGINIVGIDRPQGYCHQANSENIDYCADFLELDVFPENSADIIYWLSAIEYNKTEKIRQLVQKSMSLLKEGGLFLATFAVSEKTHWFQDSEQTNLSVTDSMDIFDVDEVHGDLHAIKEKYRKNVLFLRDKYERRYHRFGPGDPAFVVGATRRIKAETRVKNLSSEAMVQGQPYLYLFVPSNDTHVHWMHPLSKTLEKSCFMVIPEKNERADFHLGNLGEKFFVCKSGILGQIKPDVLVLGCDWGGYEQRLVQEAKYLGIPTVCIQEGCLDFIDQRSNRMLHADYAFLQGPVMRRYIRKEKNVFVTGNPKYDSLYETPLPHEVTVMINSNFTYGIFEDARDQWVRDVAETCKGFGLDFFISQHPRDKGVFPSDYKVIKSDAFKLSRQLENTSILVSRFSTVIYEAAAMGREAVYYNPHGEPFRIFAQDDTGGIHVANTRSELIRAIQSAANGLGTNSENRRKFLMQHCGTLDHDAVEKCSEYLRAIAARDTDKLSLLSQEVDELKEQNSGDGDGRTPTVSVIIPCYNTAKYLGQAIDSVLSQTFSDFEIVVVDDASTDNPAEVTHSFNDARIRFIRHSENKGPSAARNTGIRCSRGRYICFLDSDDYFLPHKLEGQVTFLENYPDYGLVGGTSMRVDEDGNVLRDSELRAGPVFPEEILVRNRFCMHTTLIRRKWIELDGFFDESLRAAEDWDLHCQLAALGCLMYRMNDTVSAYRLRSGSLSTDAQGHTANFMKVIEKNFVNRTRQPELSELKAQAKGLAHLWAAAFLYAANDTQNGRYHFSQALRNNPNLYKNKYDMTIRNLLGWLDHLNVHSPADYFHTLLDNLPEEARSMQHLRQQIIHSATSHRLLSSYKDKHRGQRCIIIGNGPSLKKMDLSFLKSEITIGFDKIDLKIGENDFSPTYYICLNPLLVDQNPDTILKTPSIKFLNLEVRPYINNATNIISLRKKDKLLFAKDPREGLGDGRTTTFTAMQLAYFMGFSEVILIGDDHNLITSDNISRQMEHYEDADVHFALDYFGKDAKSSLTNLEKVKIAYQMAKIDFESDGRRIIDATVDSKLAIFPKADYRQIFFSKSPPLDTGRKVCCEKTENADSNNQNKVELPDRRKNGSNANHVIRWGNFWDEPRPDSIGNLYAIASSYKKLGKLDTAGTLFEKILKPLQDAIDGIDFAACSEFIDQHEIAECYVSTCTKLAQCYAKQGSWDKVQQIYLGLLKRQHLRLPEPQKQDILNVLKKLGNADIPVTAPENNAPNLQRARTIESDTTHRSHAANNRQTAGQDEKSRVSQNAYRSQTQTNQNRLTSRAAPIRQTQISKPLVSVIIPAYNAGKYMAAAIESVVSQSYGNFELVIINDGSTDNTEETALGFKDARIRYSRQENRGLAATHNAGIGQSRGEFIIKLDADDMMAPDFISKHLQEFEKHPEADLVYCDDFLIDERGKPIRVIECPEYTDRKSLIRDLFRSGFPIVPFRTCIRRSVFDKIGFFDENLAVGEDYDMMRRFAKHGLNVHHLKNALYLRRMGFDSLSREFTAQKAESLFEILGRFVETFTYDELFPDVAWEKIAPERRQLHGKCLVAATYLAMGQAHAKANSPAVYVKKAFGHAWSQLNDCLKIDPDNRQIRELIQKCELGRQTYDAPVQQAAC